MKLRRFGTLLALAVFLLATAAQSAVHRVYPGDGIAPLNFILQTLRDNGTQTVLSLELFNRDYWAQDALTVARTGLEKMRASVAKSQEK